LRARARAGELSEELAGSCAMASALGLPCGHISTDCSQLRTHGETEMSAALPCLNGSMGPDALSVHLNESQRYLDPSHLAVGATAAAIAVVESIGWAGSGLIGVPMASRICSSRASPTGQRPNLITSSAAVKID
jgi:hypothetical protein